MDRLYFPLLKTLCLSTLLSLIIPLNATEVPWQIGGGHQISIGPEIYHVQRKQEGDVEQTGNLYGGRITYERLKRYSFYWGIDGLYATGQLIGKRGRERAHSCLTDANIEGRLGYTLQASCWGVPTFTPFVGAGFFQENNHYSKPFRVYFCNRFSYVSVGFLASIFVIPQFSIGINFKTRIIFDGKQKVTHDPEFEGMTLHYEEKLQYRAELPLIYYFCWDKYPLALRLEPFYEYRQYGHRANFPFDFFETTFKLYGATLQLMALF